MNKVLLSITFGFLFLFIFVQVQAKATNGYTQAIDPVIDSPGKTIGSDFNGDGIHDFLVSADLNDGGGTNKGAVYVFFGSSNLSATLDLGGVASADVTIIGKADSDYLGRGIASAGDVNGDGIDDIIAGAHGNADGTGANPGAAYLFFGSSTLSGTIDLGGAQSADLSILGIAYSDNLGRNNVVGGGDINGDGFDDIIVGAHGNGPVAANTGAIYIFFGASGLSGTKNLGGISSADVTFLGKAGNDRFGYGLSGAGDVNGDGFDDFIAGAPQNDEGAGESQNGAAYVFYGSSSLTGTNDINGTASADVTVLGKATDNYLGRGVAGGGDINGDGFDDFLVGAYKNDDSAGVNNAGAGYVFFGSSTLSGTKSLGAGQSADATFLGKDNTDQLTRKSSISGIGDVNDDGFDDVMVGAVGAYEAYIFFGSSSLSGTKDLAAADSPDVTVSGTNSSDLGLNAVSGIGDVNIDGIADFIVGAQADDAGRSNAGAAYVFFGASNLSGTKSTASTDDDVRILGKANTDHLGYEVGGGRSNPGP